MPLSCDFIEPLSKLKSREMAIDIYNSLEAIRKKEKPCMRDDLYLECKAAHYIKSFLIEARRAHREITSLCFCEISCDVCM